jgi:hypothetical protein
MAYEGGERRQETSITEDRVENIMRKLLDEHHIKIDALCAKNLETGILKHVNGLGHLTEGEKTMIYDGANYIKNKGQVSALVRWGLSLPVFGLIIERCISYFMHKWP